MDQEQVVAYTDFVQREIKASEQAITRVIADQIKILHDRTGLVVDYITVELIDVSSYSCQSTVLGPVCIRVRFP